MSWEHPQKSTQDNISLCYTGMRAAQGNLGQELSWEVFFHHLYSRNHGLGCLPRAPVTGPAIQEVLQPEVHSIEAVEESR